jgi:hypothetical protein
MPQYLSREQHQMLEDLTGLEHTRTGQVRKIGRPRWLTKKLGLIDQIERQICAESSLSINELRHILKNNLPFPKVSK